MSTTTTSRYANDPRVTAYEIEAGKVGYTVNANGRIFEVLPTDVFAWVICEGPNLEFVEAAEGRLAIGISSADGAIAALIGDPQ